MVKIIEEGSLTKRATCKRCKSKLEYEPSDVESTHYEDSPARYSITCPMCREKLGPNTCSVTVEEPWKEQI